jgi:hypothetical protein
MHLLKLVLLASLSKGRVKTKKTIMKADGGARSGATH